MRAVPVAQLSDNGPASLKGYGIGMPVQDGITGAVILHQPGCRQRPLPLR